MPRFIALARKFLRSSEGASLIEYALHLVLLATVTIAMIAILGGSISSVFRSLATTM
jgi:Flp pilus assembly pilin Flp